MKFSVDELILRGFPAAGRYRVSDAMASEMRALDWKGARETTWLPPLTLRLNEGDSPERVGQELARALHRALVGGAS